MNNTVSFVRRNRFSFATSKQAKLLISALAILASVTFWPLDAYASAIGYSYWGVHAWHDIPIPAGQLTGGVFGKHLWVSDAGGNFLSAGNLCNWHVDIDFLDGAGHRYDYITGKTVEHCSHEGTQKWLVQKSVRPGLICIRLYTAFNHRVSSVCHNIHW